MKTKEILRSLYDLNLEVLELVLIPDYKWRAKAMRREDYLAHRDDRQYVGIGATPKAAFIALYVNMTRDTN